MKNNDKRETRAALWAELQTIVDTEGALSADQAEAFDRIEGEIRSLDEAIRADDVRARFDALASAPSRTVTAPGAPKRETRSAGLTDDWDATLRYWRSGGRDMSGLQRRDLNTTDDSAVVPSDLAAEVVRLMGGVQGARQAVRVMTAPTDYRVPTVSTRVSITAITPEGEGADETEPTFATVDFGTDKKAFAVTELTDEVLQDARIDLVSEVTLQHAEELGRFWSSAICNGITGTNAIFENGVGAVTNQVTAASASAITAAELIDMRYGDSGLPAQYWSSMGPLSWIMGQDTFAYLMGKEDTTGRPLFQNYAASTLADAPQATLLGLPVHIDAGAPAFSTGNAVVALVAQNAYRVVDREPGLVTRLDPYSRQSEGIVKVNSYWRSVGKFVRPEAAVVLSLA